METGKLVSTRERHGIRLPEAQRGVRFWSRVELPQDSWFVVEGCVGHPDGSRSVSRHMTADFFEALQICREATFEWVRLLAYIRAPTLFQTGHIFEVVSEAICLDLDDSLLLRFGSGLNVVLGPASSKSSLGRRLYLAD
jgi:hypothetical protein